VKREQIRQKLLARRGELERRSRAVNADLRRENEPLAADFAEQVTQRENDDVLGALGESASAEAAAIAAALSRLARGEYDVCARCGGSIEAPRLEAVPYTTLCVRCAGAAEQEAPRPVVKSAY
jgi:RNA polymerase-binding transcription factor DksA